MDVQLNANKQKWKYKRKNTQTVHALTKIERTNYDSFSSFKYDNLY